MKARVATAHTCTVGIVGMGSFGMFAAQLLRRHARVLVYDENPSIVKVPGVRKMALPTLAAEADFIILAVPLGATAEVLCTLRSHLHPKTLLIDVCSVKTEPTKLYEKLLPGHTELLMTHPLFGPESAAKTTRGHTIVVTNKPTARGERVLSFCKDQLGINIVRVDAAQHDEAMAEVHALTFFIARALNVMHLGEPSFMTPSFHMLEQLVDYDRHHSEALFLTMERGNPFARSVRDRFVRTLVTINDNLEQS